MLHEGKVAIVYGGGGNIGGTTARLLAKEGAHVFLAGMTEGKLEAVTNHITSTGGSASHAIVDVLDEAQVTAHIQAVFDARQRIDIVVNAIGIQPLQGVPLTEMKVEDVLFPIDRAVRSNFIIAKSAAKHMIPSGGGGVIVTISTSASSLSGRDRVYHKTGGYSTACAAIEQMTYSWAAQLGPKGIRVVCIRPDALPETWPAGAGEEIKSYMQDGTILGRMPALREVAEAVSWVASGKASAMTGTVMNLSCGSIVG